MLRPKCESYFRFSRCRTTTPGEVLELADDTSHTLAYAANFDEWDYLADYAANQGWIEKAPRDRSGNQDMRLTPAGWEEAQRRRGQRISPRLCRNVV